ncbi:hypothetical protein D3C84_990460 [compost metagenome]
MLDVAISRALQHPGVGIMGDIFSRLTVTQAGAEETHQFAIVVFQHSTWPRRRGVFPALGERS